MKISDCPDAERLHSILQKAFDVIANDDIQTIVAILDNARQPYPSCRIQDEPLLIARNLLLNAALAPRTWHDHTPIHPDPQD